MSMISSLRTYLASYSGMKTGAPLWVDYLGGKATQYSIGQSGGAVIVEEYIDGSSMRELQFVFQSAESTADDLERLENLGFYEDFAAWMESQTAAESLPTLGNKQKSISIQAVSSAYLFEEGKSDTGIYQIQCKLTYSQQP